MSTDNKLQSAVEFLLDQHLVGAPSDEEAKQRFATAKSHRAALAMEDKAQEAAAAVEAQAQAPSAPVVPSAPQIPQVPKVG